jgi:hypothetical protein
MKKKSGKNRDEVALEEMGKEDKKKALDYAKGIASPYHIPGFDVHKELAVIERKVGSNSMALGKNETRMSTGLLMLDIVMGGGLTAGLYTNFGKEQTAKTTGTIHVMASALLSSIPIISYWDFEGCFCDDTKICIKGKDIKFSDIYDTRKIPNSIGFTSETFSIDSVSRKDVRANIYYGGIQSSTKITTNKGTTFEGYHHPFLVKGRDGPEWRKLEDLKPGDVVYKKKKLMHG